MESTTLNVLNFIQLNTDFSKSASLLLETHILKYDADIAIVQDIYCEKFGLSQDYRPFNFPNYNVFFYKDDSKNIPKVALYIRDTLNVTYFPQASDHHSITCLVHINNSEYFVVSSVYSPPPDNSPVFRTSKLFRFLNTQQIERLLMCGDFNSHSSLWSNYSKNDAKGDELEILFLSKDLSVLNDVTSKPTFENTRGGKSWIDISTAGSKIADKISNWCVKEDESLSFHKIITFRLSLSPTQNNRIRYNFSKTNWETFNKKMGEKFSWNNISVQTISSTSIEDLDILAENVSILTKETIETTVPCSKNYKNRKLVSWWNTEISDLRKSVNNARRRKQKFPNAENLEFYRAIRNRYKILIRKTKFNDFKHFCNSADSPWDLLKKLTSNTQATCAPILMREDGTFTSNDQETGQFFLEKWFPDDNFDNDNDIHHQTRQYVENFLKLSVNPLPEITDSEMNVIYTISPLKAPGWDFAKAVVLQNLNLENKLIFKALFNQCIKFCKFPKVWQIGEGNILPKPDKKDETNYKSYRCITLLSVIGKWFEKIIMKRLMWKSMNSNLMSNRQFGFIPGRSCEDAVCSIVSIIENAFLHKRYVVVIFLDISGAFDCTWHPSILKSFIDKGYDPAYVQLISSYLSNRLVRLKINNSSASKHLSRSSPQGGGLSPFIWNTDYDDSLEIPEFDPAVLSIVDEYSFNDATSQAYADDSQLVVISDTLHNCQIIGNDLLDKVYKHSHSKKQSYSAEKTKAVIFTRQKIKATIELKLNGKLIDICENAKLVGINLDSRLSWKKHINDQVTKSKRLLFLLNKCCKLKWGLQSHSLCQIWTGVIEHILLYGAPAWASCSQSLWLQTKLESVQRLAAIKIIKGFKSISYEAAITLSGLTPIMTRLHQKCIVYAVKHHQHYSQNPSPEHVNTTKRLAESYDIDIFSHETPIKIPLDVPPYKQITFNTNAQTLCFYPLRENNCINFYTDGSKSERGTGCAFVMFPPKPHKIHHSQRKLNKDNSIFQSELFAILQGLKHLFTLPLNLISSCSIRFFTDSKSTLDSISDPEPDSLTVREIQNFLRFYSAFTRVEINWCRGHANIIGNEMADYFARQSVFLPNVTNQMKYPLSLVKSKIKSLSKVNWLRRWKNSDKGRDTYQFIPNNVPKHLVSMPHNHKLTQILTGHSRLNMYLNQIGVEKDPACACLENIETVDHYLFHCKLESINRTNTITQACFKLGIEFPPKKHQLVENIVLFRSLLSFLMASKRLDFDK